MSEVTRILCAIEEGDLRATEQLLPLVYDELRKLAAHKLKQEKLGQTLQATALVHEAYLRLVASRDESASGNRNWNSRGHFFAAAAEAMRRILVEQARRKHRFKHGGDRRRVELDEALSIAEPAEDLVALDEALNRLATVDSLAAKLVNLRYFSGLSMAEAAEVMGIPLRTVERNWTYAKSWLHRALDESAAGRGQSPPH
jgi:RNA polymerase sigma factor (TIGR02999 family)